MIKGKNGSEYTRTTEKGETQVINFLYNPEDKKYSIDTLDKDGGSRPATKDDYKALAIVMKENGISSVTITDLQDKDLENAIEGLKEAGVKVENIDEVKDRIDKYKKEEKTENATNEAESTAKSRAEKGKETTVVVEKGETEQDSQSKPETGNATKEKAQAESKGKPDASKTTKKDDINLVNVTNYIKGLRIDGRAEMEAKGEKTVKFKDLSDAEKKLARQLHAHRMNIIKQAKAKGVSDKDIEALATAGTVGWLQGRLSGTKSTLKRNKQINALAKANVSKAMESSKISKGR